MLNIEKISKELNKSASDSRLDFNFKVESNEFKILHKEENWTTIQFNGQLLQVNNKCNDLVEKTVRSPEGVVFVSVDKETTATIKELMKAV